MLKRCKDWKGSNLDVYKIVDASDVGAGYTRHVWKGETGATQIGTTMVEAITSMIQKNGVLSVSGIRQANATKDVYLVDIPGIDEFGTYDGMKLLIDFDQTNQTNLVYLLVNNTEYKINDVVLNELQTNNKYLCEMKNNIINIVINKQATETIKGISQIATQPEVDDGLEDTKIVTPKKLKASLDSMLASITTNFVKLTQLATESIAGIIKISTTAQVTAGTDNTTAVSPAKLKEMFVNGSTKTQNGYQKLPSGVIMQWGMIADGVTNVTFPVAFPTGCASLQITRGGGTNADSVGSLDVGASVIISMSNTGFMFDSVVQAVDKSLVYYVAIGY